ncbi:hypothetical protein IGI86_001883 [Enterococcus sp. AZ188]
MIETLFFLCVILGFVGLILVGINFKKLNWMVRVGYVCLFISILLPYILRFFY